MIKELQFSDFRTPLAALDRDSILQDSNVLSVIGEWICCLSVLSSLSPVATGLLWQLLTELPTLNHPSSTCEHFKDCCEIRLSDIRDGIQHQLTTD